MARLFFCLHIGLATSMARPICDKNHRLAMYEMTVTMYYILISLHYVMEIPNWNDPTSPQYHNSLQTTYEPLHLKARVRSLY